MLTLSPLSPPSAKGLVNLTGSFPKIDIEDAMINGTGDYKDIDNALSAGGHDGNGSPQTEIVDNSGTSGLSTLSLFNPPNPKKKNSPTYSSGGSSGSSSPTKKKKKIYYEAPIAKKYGFDKTTAYQEALANTAYRREMEDMRKAGLNPSVIYGDHNTSGAASNIYPREESSGSGGSGGYGRRYGRSNSGKYVFSGGAYYGLMFAAGAIATAATGNVGAGMAAAGLTGTALKAFNGFFNK